MRAPFDSGMDTFAIGRSPFYFTLTHAVGPKMEVDWEWQLKSVFIFDDNLRLWDWPATCLFWIFWLAVLGGLCKYGELKERLAQNPLQGLLDQRASLPFAGHRFGVRQVILRMLSNARRASV
jgi:hypothetical protein